MSVGARLRALRPERSRAAVAAYRLTRRLADRLGVQFLVKSFYTPIPDVRALDPAVWERRSPMAGLDLGLDRQVELLDQLAPHLADFSPPADDPGTRGEFFLDNSSYSRVDADLLYAMVRYAKPGRIVELGSGHSTLVMAAAAAANELEGATTELTAYDPFPDVAAEGAPGLAALERTAAQDVPGSVFEGLGSGDLLFVDTTHTVKVGSDVNFVVLDLLPRLAPGVLVHFHDVFLPYEYPRSWIEDLGLVWQEQYLLQAFLAMNGGYEVLLSAHALTRDRPEEVQRVVGSWRPEASPAAFWIRRTAG